MAYIEFQRRLILESEIIGIGPVFSRTGQTSEVWFFDLYCRHTTIRIESDTVTAWDRPERVTAKKEMFIKEHGELRERVEYLLENFN